jgi:hypothetical protein
MGKNKDKKQKKKNKKKSGAKNEARLNTATARAPSYLSDRPEMDYLDEDPVESAQQYTCISFIAPGEEMIEDFIEQMAGELAPALAPESKMSAKEKVANVVERFKELNDPKCGVKVRNSRPSVEQCRKHIQELMETDDLVHIFTVETGKWVTFNPSPELIEDENYREEQLNTIMKEKKLGQQRTKQFYRQRMREKTERARLEGTKEGQEILMAQEEPFQAVEHRAKSAQESIDEFREKIVELEKTKELAERKLEKMIAEGKDKDEEETMKPAVPPELTDDDAERTEAIRAELRKADEIESARQWPEQLGQAMADHERAKQAAEEGRPEEGRPEEGRLPADQSAMFDNDVIIPSRDRKDKEELNE